MGSGRLQHLLREVRNLHLGPDANSLARPGDQEWRTGYSHIGPAIHAFFNPGANGLAKAALFVGSKVHIQAIFQDEACKLLHRVFRYAKKGTDPLVEFRSEASLSGKECVDQCRHRWATNT